MELVFSYMAYFCLSAQIFHYHQIPHSYPHHQLLTHPIKLIPHHLIKYLPNPKNHHLLTLLTYFFDPYD